jgi:hypothetical protein
MMYRELMKQVKDLSKTSDHYFALAVYAREGGCEELAQICCDYADYYNKKARESLAQAAKLANEETNIFKVKLRFLINYFTNK